MTPLLVQIADCGALRTVTLNRPEKANALTTAMMQSLAHTLRTAPESSLIVLQGAGPKGFCAGADILEFLEEDSGLERQQSALLELAAALINSRCPVVAALHGRTLGAGVLIASLCDLVIASDDLVYGLPEIRFNMYPAIVQAALQARLSEALAYQLCITGRLLSATEALNLGLATHVVASTDFEREVASLIDFYSARTAAMRIGRLARREAATALKRIQELAPLLHENFNAPEVRDTIRRYLRKS